MTRNDKETPAAPHTRTIDQHRPCPPISSPCRCSWRSSLHDTLLYILYYTYSTYTYTIQQTATRWQDADVACQTVRLCGMIQDLGETEYLPLDDRFPGMTGAPRFVERQPVVVVTDWAAPFRLETAAADEGTDEEHREKRVRRHISRHRASPTTVLIYLYHEELTEDDDQDMTTPSRNTRTALKLHQLVEWMAVKEEDVVAGDVFTEAPGSTGLATSLSGTPSWGSTDDCFSIGASRAAMPQLHALSYRHCRIEQAAPALDALASPLLDTPQAVVMLAQACQVSPSVATALWLTLLSQAEAVAANADTPAAPLGCASLQLVLPSTEAADRLVQTLQTLLTAILPLVHTWPTHQAFGSLPRLEQRYGRIQRHPWQLPPGTTILLQHTTPPTSTTKSSWAAAAVGHLLQRQALPLRCEGGCQVNLPVDWRWIVVATPATARELPACTTTLDLSSWTPVAYQAPPAATLAALAHTLTARRQQVPSVALPPAILEEAPRDFCRLRQQGRQSGAMPDEAAFHRWLTYTRLWARSRGASTANMTDWRKALQLEEALGSVRFV
jgi:hypothetical protein